MFHRAVHNAGRVATSATLASVVAAGVIPPLLLSSFVTDTRASGAKQGAATGPIRVVDAPGSKQSECAGQTWPYKHAGCGAAKVKTPVADTAPASPPVSPVSVVKVVAPIPQPVAESSPKPPLQAAPPTPVRSGETGAPAILSTSNAKPEDAAGVKEATLLPVPPGAESRGPAESMSASPSPVGATAMLGAAAAGATVAALDGSQVQPRAERRRRGIYSRQRIRLFGFRF